MIDLVLLGFVVLIAAMGFKRPFFWVLLFIYVDLVMPQRIGWWVLSSLSLSLMVFVLAFGGWLLLDSKAGTRFTFRQGLLLALMVLCGLTTLTAQFPEDAAAKWAWVWTALLFAIFFPLTLRTRLRVEAAALFMVLSVGAIAIGGGIKTVLGGGGYGTLRLLVNDNAGIYEGSIFSTAAIAIIPLALWLARHGTIFRPHWLVSAFAAGLIFACLLIPVGTNARTGLICIAVLAALMLRSVRYRAVYSAFAGLALIAAVPFLPQSFLDRMGTIAKHQEDQSASTRLAVWRWTIEYVGERPFGGGFDAYRANSFTYRMPVVKGEGNAQRITHEVVTDRGRAYHSSYFEMLGEQGWLGLALWLWLHGLGLWQMERVRRWAARAASAGEGAAGANREARWQLGFATALQQAHVVYLVGALFVGIAYQPFAFLIVGLQIGLWNHARAQRRGLPASPPMAPASRVPAMAAPAPAQGLPGG